jgi:hypothetical protein
MSIIASFSSGLDVFKKLKETKRRPKRSRNGSVDEEEVKLTKSLRQGPEDIGREYRNNVQMVGNSFAVGDGMLPTLADG